MDTLQNGYGDSSVEHGFIGASRRRRRLRPDAAVGDRLLRVDRQRQRPAIIGAWAVKNSGAGRQ